MGGWLAPTPFLLDRALRRPPPAGQRRRAAAHGSGALKAEVVSHKEKLSREVRSRMTGITTKTFAPLIHFDVHCDTLEKLDVELLGTVQLKWESSTTPAECA